MARHDSPCVSLHTSTDQADPPIIYVCFFVAHLRIVHHRRKGRFTSLSRHHLQLLAVPAPGTPPTGTNLTLMHCPTAQAQSCYSAGTRVSCYSHARMSPQFIRSKSQLLKSTSLKRKLNLAVFAVTPTTRLEFRDSTMVHKYQH